ncbi:MAG: NADH:flavin oxidoreductase/NADH oxidase family protein [Steroidobacteraceae bacterium]
MSLDSPLALPCGAVLPNRLCKAAMTEGLADGWLRSTPRLESLYRTWSEGGAGLLITGNIQVDRQVLERPGNVAIDVNDPVTVSPEARRRLSAWARAGTVAGNHLWTQISHAGRQSPRYVTQRPLAPSAVQLEILGSYARPRALTEADILALIDRYARAAEISRECGFTGVQVHGAHGYLISSFLSPVTNRRSDAWGGSLENRARFLIEVLRATRRRVGADFPVGLKLNSDDFRKGGFSNEECIRVVEWLNEESVDLLEVSGGTYEQPRLIGFEGKRDSAVPVRESTRRREAYFGAYAEGIRQVARMPLMITGGFRSAAAMAGAIGDGDCDVIGLGRPLCTEPDLPRRLMADPSTVARRSEDELVYAKRGWRSPTSPLLPLRVMNVLSSQGWYYQQIFRLADQGQADPSLSLGSAAFAYLLDEFRSARRLHRCRRHVPTD